MRVRGQQGRDQISARVPEPVGDHGVDVAGQPVQGRLDPRQILLEVDPERLAQVVGPVGDLRPLVVGQTEQQTKDAGGVRLGELANELHSATLGIAVDQVVGQRLELGPHGFDGLTAERRAEKLTQAQVVGAFETQQRLAPPLDKRAVGHAVLGGPPGVPLLEAPVLEHRRALGVTQDGPAVRGGRVPVLLARLVHHRRGDVESGIGEVDMRGHARMVRPANQEMPAAVVSRGWSWLGRKPWAVSSYPWNSVHCRMGRPTSTSCPSGSTTQTR